MHTKRKKYQSRKDLIRSEKIRITILALVFLLVLIGLAFGGFFVGKQKSFDTNSGNTNDTSLTKNYKLGIGDVPNQEFTVNEEITPVVLSLMLNDKPVSKFEETENELLQFDLFGTLPSGLSFDSTTGTISGTPTQLFYLPTPFCITTFYYPNKSEDNCVVKRTNQFNIKVIGLEFTNSIENISTYYGKGKISTDVPLIKFDNQVVSQDIIFSLSAESDPFIPGLSLSSTGVIEGTPTEITTNQFVYQIKATKISDKTYTAYSNKFTICVLNNDKKIQIRGINNINTFQYDDNENHSWINPELTIGDETYTTSADGVEISYTLDEIEKNSGVYPEQLNFDSNDGTIHGIANTLYQGMIKLTANVSGKYDNEFSVIFLVNIKPNEFVVTPLGKNDAPLTKIDNEFVIEVGINTEPTIINFSATINKENIIGVDEFVREGRGLAGEVELIEDENILSPFLPYKLQIDLRSDVLTGNSESYELVFKIVSGYLETTSKIKIVTSNSLVLDLATYYAPKTNTFLFFGIGGWKLDILINSIDYDSFRLKYGTGRSSPISCSIETSSNIVNHTPGIYLDGDFYVNITETASNGECLKIKVSIIYEGRTDEIICENEITVLYSTEPPRATQ